jgi:ParB-like nuclease domain
MESLSQENPKTRPSSLKTVDVRVDLLVPNEHNINTMSQKKLERLVESIREHGFLQPAASVVPMHDGRYLILGGHHRWMAGKIANYEYVPCTVLTGEKWSDEGIRNLTAWQLNIISGNPDPDKAKVLYERIVQEVGAESAQNVLAIVDEKEWKKFLKTIGMNLKDAGVPPEVIEKVKKQSKSAKSIDDISNSINKLLQKHADTVKGSLVVFTQGEIRSVTIALTEHGFDALKYIIDHCDESEEKVSEMLSPILVGAAVDLKENK